MKHRLVELLQCVSCCGQLDVSEAETKAVPQGASAAFSCQRFCSLDGTATIPPSERCAECSRIEVVKGVLTCRQCSRTFPIIESVPWLFVQPSGKSGRQLADTATLYSHLWTSLDPAAPDGPGHIGDVEEALGASVVQGQIGLEAGSGNGNDTTIMAQRHPKVEVVSMDMSEGVYRTKRRTAGLPNVHVVRGSVLAIPLRSDVCDFGYSFGVLHHTTDPRQGLREIVRILKKDGCASLYLYEDHSDNLWKAIPLQLISVIRLGTTKLNVRLLSGLCYLLSPFVVLVFSLPARVMSYFRFTKPLAEKMPFNFGTSLFSVHGDLVDRFGAPIELRYNRKTLTELLHASGLSSLHIGKLRSVAGWAARGVKSSL